MALGACPPTTIITCRAKRRARKPQTWSWTAAICRETITTTWSRAAAQTCAEGLCRDTYFKQLYFKREKFLSNLMNAKYCHPIYPSSLCPRWATCPICPWNTKPFGTTAYTRLTAEIFLSEEDSSIISIGSPLFSHYLHSGAKNNQCRLEIKRDSCGATCGEGDTQEITRTVSTQGVWAAEGCDLSASLRLLAATGIEANEGIKPWFLTGREELCQGGQGQPQEYKNHSDRSG